MNGPEVAVRPAGPDDLAGIAAIEMEAFGNDRGARTLAGDRSGAAAPLEAWVAVASDGTLVAFASARVVAEELEIFDVAVRRDRRGRGVGRLLVGHVLRVASGRGAQRAVLEVARSNAAARRVYETLGFTACGVRPGYYRGGTEDALVLARPLP